jgi:hypothetical protein
MLLYLQIKGRDWHVTCMIKSEIGKFVGTLENVGTDCCRSIVVDGNKMLKWNLILVDFIPDSVAEVGML